MQYTVRARRRPASPSLRASTSLRSRPSMPAASARASRLGTTSPAPSTISGIGPESVTTTGRPAALPDHGEVRAPADLGKRAQQPLPALLVVEAGDGDDQRRVSQAQLLADAAPVGALEPRDVDGVVDHGKARGRDSVR